MATDPSPDTPSVYAPRCGHHGNPLTWLGDDHRWRCPDCFPELFPATPTAPRPSSPDTAALVARLRGAASMFAEDPDGTAWVVTPDPHDLTVENILYVADYSPDACGCEHRGDRWFLCSYHEGYDDGVERMVAILERMNG